VNTHVHVPRQQIETDIKVVVIS